MGRGGRRPGAGRKPVLSSDDEIWIFSECLRLSDVLTELKHICQTQAYLASFNCPKRDLYIEKVLEVERDMRGWSDEQVRQSQGRKRRSRSMLVPPQSLKSLEKVAAIVVESGQQRAIQHRLRTPPQKKGHRARNIPRPQSKQRCHRSRKCPSQRRIRPRLAR